VADPPPPHFGRRAPPEPRPAPRRPDPQALKRKRSTTVAVGAVGLLALGGFAVADQIRARNCASGDSAAANDASTRCGGAGGHFGAGHGWSSGGGAEAAAFGGFGATGHGFAGGE
jgi:hypothetical protein